MLRLDFNLVLEMINLVVLFLILRKFLFRPVMNIMEKRKAMIAEGLKNADEQQSGPGGRSSMRMLLSGAKDESLR
ncbi:MAG: ATP synthase F0 subunit B [[Clostridium] scindens]